ncbi:cytochrome P450 [Hygrophoropsis aurantiaca]|uniref:Cytochrome P450 n=1 Tax=Hygrophoropsis aurantiaca TaxID=72124 RepID=A0ACB8AJK0_9AGAM|nr:cytochrome P450 [Hygrophoropsis aurantiaca]
MFSLATVSALCVIVLTLVWSSKQTKRKGLPLPPGPRPLPLLGNAHQINTSQPWLTYAAWGKQYGGIVYSRLLGQDYIIINDENIVKTLLDQRGAIYSDRPVIATYMNKMCGIDFNTSFLPYGDLWRAHRKIFHQTLREDKAALYHDLYLRKAHDFVQNLINFPGDLETHAETLTASLIMAVTYGYETQIRDDPFVNRVQGLVDIVLQTITPALSALLTGLPFFERLPEWFPGAAFKRRSRLCRDLSAEVVERPFQYVIEQMAKEIAPQSMVSDFHRNAIAKGEGDQDRVLKEVAATVYVGGFKTTSSNLHSFLLAMVLYPEVQQRAQAEIDAVIGDDRLPNFDDRAALPYVEAICREVLRWSPAAPLSVPHATSNDDTFNGYYIPKGATVILNAWGIAHNEAVYPDPFHFKPERHFTADGQLKDDSLSNNLFFGSGRRICPGRFFAERSMWAAIVSVLSSIRIEKARGPDGKEIEVRPDFTTGMVIYPKPFQCSVTSRSATKEKLLRGKVTA